MHLLISRRWSSTEGILPTHFCQYLKLVLISTVCYNSNTTTGSLFTLNFKNGSRFVVINKISFYIMVFSPNIELRQGIFQKKSILIVHIFNQVLNILKFSRQLDSTVDSLDFRIQYSVLETRLQSFVQCLYILYLFKFSNI